MSIEALWYSSYVGGKAPKCKRYCRLPMAEQWEMVIDFAISWADGRSGYRPVFISLTREQYWYWPEPLSYTGWWLVPARIVARSQQLHREAMDQAFRRHSVVSSGQIAAVLRRWKRTGVWRRHANAISPVHPDPLPKRKRGLPS